MGTSVQISLLDAYKKVNLAATNNFPLFRTISFDDIVNESDYINDQNDIDNNINNDLNAVRYEEVYENLASYPHEIDMTNPKYVITTYITGITSSITVTTDMLVKNIIRSTISGDTPTGIDLVKTSIITGSKINVTYS